MEFFFVSDLESSSETLCFFMEFRNLGVHIEDPGGDSFGDLVIPCEELSTCCRDNCGIFLSLVYSSVETSVKTSENFSVKISLWIHLLLILRLAPLESIFKILAKIPLEILKYPMENSVNTSVAILAVEITVKYFWFWYTLCTPEYTRFSSR